MADYPRILAADARRLTEGAIRVRIMAEVSNASTCTLWESHEVAGDRLLVVIHQGERQQMAGAVTPEAAGRRELDIQIAQHDSPDGGIRFVDIYGGDYDMHNARRVILPRLQPQ